MSAIRIDRYAIGSADGAAAKVIPALTADIGPDLTVAALVTVSSTASVSFALTRPAGSSATLSSASGTSTTYTPDVSGAYLVTGTHAQGGKGASALSLVLATSPPSYTLGTVAAQTDLVAPTMPGISSLVATGTPSYLWTLADPLGADASALLTGATTATPTCAALSTWTGKFCGKWTATVAVTDDVGTTTKSTSWTVGVRGQFVRYTLSLATAHDFKVAGATVDQAGVTVTATNAANASALAISGGAIACTWTSGAWSAAAKTAPTLDILVDDLATLWTRVKRTRVQVKFTHPSSVAGHKIGIALEASDSNLYSQRLLAQGDGTINDNELNGGSASNGSSTAATIGLVVGEMTQNAIVWYTAAAGSDFLPPGDVGLTLRRQNAFDLSPGDTDRMSAGRRLRLVFEGSGAGVSFAVQGLCIDVEVD